MPAGRGDERGGSERCIRRLGTDSARERTGVTGQPVRVTCEWTRMRVKRTTGPRSHHPITSHLIRGTIFRMWVTTISFCATETSFNLPSDDSDALSQPVTVFPRSQLCDAAALGWLWGSCGSDFSPVAGPRPHPDSLLPKSGLFCTTITFGSTSLTSHSRTNRAPVSSPPVERCSHRKLLIRRGRYDEARRRHRPRCRGRTVPRRRHGRTRRVALSSVRRRQPP